MKKYKVQKNGKSTVVEADSPEEAHSIANQGGFGRAFFQGLTDYTGDEAEAAVLANLPTAITGDPRSYQQVRDEVRRNLKTYKELNSGKAFTAEMLGAVTQGVLSSLRTRNPITPIYNTADVLKRNALQGARIAAGDSEADLTEGNVGDFTVDVAEGAGIGAGAGTLFEKGLGALGQTAKQFGKKITNNLSQRGKAVDQLSKGLGISQPAAEIVYSLYNANQSFSQMVQTLRKAGNQGMIVDADKTIAQLADAIQTSGSQKASKIISESAESRANKQADTLRPIMDKTLGEPPEGLQTAVDAVASRTFTARDQAYKKAYDQPIDYASNAGRRIEKIVDDLAKNAPREYKQAIQSANLNMAADGQKNMQILAKEMADGTFTIESMPNVIQLDYLKQALQATYDRTGDVGFKKFSEQLRDAGVEAVPLYGKALKLGQQKIEETEIIKLGGKMLQNNVKPDEVIKAINAASKTEMDAIKLGVRSQIEDILDQTRKNIGDVGKDTSGATAEESKNLLKVLSSTANRKKIKLVLGDEQSEQLFNSLDEIESGLQLLNSLSGNSKTAVRQDLNRIIDKALEPGVIGTVLQGELGSVPQKIIQAVTQRTPEALQDRKDAILSEVAIVLTRAKGREAEEALKLIDKAVRGVTLSQSQGAFISKVYQAASGASAGLSQGVKQQVIQSDPLESLTN